MTWFDRQARPGRSRKTLKIICRATWSPGNWTTDCRTSEWSVRSRSRERSATPWSTTSASARGLKTRCSCGKSPAIIGILSNNKIQHIRLAPGTEVRPSRIDGRGCFATVAFKKGRKIAEYAGERIPRQEVARRLKNKRRIYICGVDSYWAIDGSTAATARNSSIIPANPICYSKVVHNHILFFAMRDIEPGEELLLDYGESYHSNRKRCLCGFHRAGGGSTRERRHFGATEIFQESL